MRGLFLPACLLLVALPVAAADPPKPAPRAKLLGNVKIDGSGSLPIWTPDGKRIVLPMRNKRVALIDPAGLSTDPSPVKFAEADLEDGHWIRLSPDGGNLVSYRPARRLTEESSIRIWDLKKLIEAKAAVRPDRTIGIDGGGDVELVGSTADGKQFLITTTQTVAPPRQLGAQDSAPSFERTSLIRIDGSTGDHASELAKFDTQSLQLKSAAAARSVDRFFVHLHAESETIVRCLDFATGKSVWERKLENTPSAGFNGEILSSPDGGRVAVLQSVQLVAPPGGQPRRGGFGRVDQADWAPVLVLLDAKSGEPLNSLDIFNLEYANLHGFSHDGRLLACSIRNSGSRTRLVVFDMSTGKTIKEWAELPKDMDLSFAPTGYKLAIRETDGSRAYREDDGFVRVEPGKMEGKTYLGVWDLAPLVK